LRALSFRFLTFLNGSTIYTARIRTSHNSQPEYGQKARNKPFGYTSCVRDTPL